MDKKTLAGALKSTADLLDLLGEEAFKVNAYRGAARSLESLEASFEDLQAAGFRGIPKVGPSIAAELAEYAQTGQFGPLEEAASLIPAGVLSLFRVRGLGPKKIRALWDAGTDSLEVLREACQDGRVANLKGFGAKSAATFLEAVEFALKAQERQHLSTACAVGEQLLTALGGLDARLAGSVRRGLDTIGDVEVTVQATEEQIEARLTGVAEDLGRAEAYPAVTGRVNGVPVEVGYGPAATRGALDLMFGGSKAFQHVLLDRAAELGLTLDSAGLRRGSELLPSTTEAEVADQLNLPLPPPEYREAEHLERGWQDLPPPEQLITVADIRGTLHTHTTWSDATASLREMAEAAVALGHTYLGTGDHSRAAAYANGMTLERLHAYIKEIRELQRAGVPLLAGAEVDILEDGSLDYPDEDLAGLDYVVASVHSYFQLSQERQTERLIRAVRHPLITILGHPTGRLLLRRPSYALDLDAVLAAAAQRGTVVEINASPYRFDLDWRAALRWRDRLQFAINTDAHSPAGLRDIGYGVMVARKAGLTPDLVVNSLGQQEFLDFVARQRAARS